MGPPFPNHFVPFDIQIKVLPCSLSS
jgi:hypothetical protein